MKKIFNWINPTSKNNDEANNILNIIFLNHSTEQSIEIFNEVQRQFCKELDKRFQENKKENKHIDNFFNPQERARNIEVSFAEFVNKN